MITTQDDSTDGNVSQGETEDFVTSWANEFPRKPDIAVSDMVGRMLDKATRPPKKVAWKKDRKKKKRPEPLPNTVDYFVIYTRHQRNLDYSWSDVVLLSQIDFWMNKNQGPCYTGMGKLAAAARLVRQGGHNRFSQLEREGKVVVLCYRGKTKARIVAPEHSAFPELSSRISAEFTGKSNDGIPF
jgi:hypothetical protein